MNDCRYGHDVRGNVLRLSVLRAPKMPDPTADVNKTHRLTYALLPHTGNFMNGVVREAYQLNCPTTARAVASHPGSLAPSRSNVSVSGENIVIETLKKAEEDNSLIVRLYEAHGIRGTRTLQTPLPVRKVVETNLMENEEAARTVQNGKVKLDFTPFQIRTLKLVL